MHRGLSNCLSIQNKNGVKFKLITINFDENQSGMIQFLEFHCNKISRMEQKDSKFFQRLLTQIDLSYVQSNSFAIFFILIYQRFALVE